MPNGGTKDLTKFKYGSVRSDIKKVNEFGRGLIQDIITLKKIKKL